MSVNNEMTPDGIVIDNSKDAAIDNAIENAIKTNTVAVVEETTDEPAESIFKDSEVETPAKESAKPSVEVPVKETATKADESKDDETEVDFTDFLKLANKPHTTEDKKVEDKTSVKEESQPKSVVQQTVNKDAKAKLPPRDLADIDDPELVPLLKEKMSRDAFDKIKPIIVEHKKLKNELAEAKKGGLPETYYTHEKGYLLTPEFETATQRVNIAGQIFNHWKQQLSAVQEGADSVDIIDIDAATGTLKIVGKADANKIGEAQLLAEMNNAQAQFIDERSKLNSIASTFKEKVNSSTQWIKNFESQAFGIFDKPEAKEYMAAVESIKESFPPAFRKLPVMDVTAKSIFVNKQLGELVKQQQAKIAELTKAISNGSVATTIKTNQRKAGPTSADTGVETSADKDDVTFDDFMRLKNS